MASSAIPFKRSLLFNLTASVAFLGAIMLAISLFATQQTVARLSGMLTDQVIATTDAQIMSFFEPIMTGIEIATDRTMGGDFEEFPVASLDAYFEPLIGEMPQVSSIMYSHNNGDEYMLLQSGGAWTSRLSRPDTRGNVVAVRQWRTDDDPRPVTEQVLDYDARSRPWFTGALEKIEQLGEDAPRRDLVHWTPPYRFFTTGEPGVTASIAHRSRTGRIIVLGFDILLGDISRFTSQLTIGEHGRVFVLRGSPAHPDGLAIIGLPADERFDSHESMLEFVLSPPDDFGGPVASFVENALTANEDQPTHAVRFSHDGQSWWGEISPSKLRTADEIWVGAIVPERELLASLPNTNLIVVIVTGFVLLVAVRRAYRLAHRYSEPVEALTQQGNRMQRMNFEPGESVDSDITEIRHLSTTLERMRSALQTFTSAREDLRVARSIRSQHLPTTIPTPAGIDIEVWQEPADELGGECYDAVTIETRDDGRPAAVVVGVFDFSATGLAAAVGGGLIRAEFRAAAAAGRGDPAEIATRLDRFVRDERPELSPLRAWLLRADEHRGLQALGFGWDDMLVRGGDRLQHVAAEETPLGIGSTFTEGKTRTLQLAAGETLVLASDGVLDALSSDRKRYRLDGLARSLLASDDHDAVSLIEVIVEDLREYSAGVRDDRTLLVIHVPDSPA